MILSYYGSIIPPEEWRHDPSKTNNVGCTVAIGLAKKGIIPT